MKLLVVKPYIVLTLFATVLNLAGCAILLNPKIDTQEITFEAEDGREYDFYVDNALVCPHTDKCVFVHNKRNSICQHTIDLKRGEIVYGTLFYGYWQERSTLAKVMAERNDNECPEVWDGESVIVEINPE